MAQTPTAAEASRLRALFEQVMTIREAQKVIEPAIDEALSHPLAKMMNQLTANYERKTYGPGRYHEESGTWSIHTLFAWRWQTVFPNAPEMLSPKDELCTFFVVPECKITSTGDLVPPGPQLIEIKHGPLVHGPSRTEIDATLPMKIMGVYDLHIRLVNGVLWIEMVKERARGLNRETYSPCSGFSGLTPFFPPSDRSEKAEWRLPTNDTGGKRLSVTLRASALTRERGYSYEKAFALAHSGRPVNPASCAGVVRQTTVYRIECENETSYFEIRAERECLHRVA